MGWHLHQKKAVFAKRARCYQFLCTYPWIFSCLFPPKGSGESLKWWLDIKASSFRGMGIPWVWEPKDLVYSWHYNLPIKSINIVIHSFLAKEQQTEKGLDLLWKWAFPNDLIKRMFVKTHWARSILYQRADGKFFGWVKWPSPQVFCLF